MKHPFSILRRAAFATALAALGATAFAQPAPEWKATRPIRFIVPFPAGGAADVAARIVAQKLGTSLGQTVVVENKAGANGLIGSQFVYSAPNDGSVFLVGTIDTQAINPLIYTNLTFPPDTLLAVAPVALSPLIMAGKKGGPARDTRELVTLAKTTNMNYGHWGVGGLGHLASEMFKAQNGIPNMQAIPFQGSAPGSQALMGGQIDMMIMPLTIGLANQERLNIYGIVSNKRFEGAMNIPTLGESGYPLNADGWVGVFAPPGTAKPIINAVFKAMGQVTDDPETRKQLITLGVVTQHFNSPDDYATWVGSEQQKWGKVIKDTGIKLVQQ